MHSWIFLFCTGCFNITSWTGVSPVGRLLCILPIPLDADWHSWRCATFIFYFSFLLPLSLWTGLLPFLVLRLLIFLKQFNCLLTYFCQETEKLFFYHVSLLLFTSLTCSASIILLLFTRYSYSSFILWHISMHISVFYTFMYIYLQRPYVIFFYSTLQLFHYNSPLS